MKKNFDFIHEKVFLNKEIIQLLNIKFSKIYNDNIYQSEHDHIREIRSNTISKETMFEEIMKKIYKKFIFLTNISDLKFKKLWLVHSVANNVDKTKLPYIPHIDKNRYLKGMVYLHDVKLKNGPIHLGKVKNTVNIEQIRKKLPKNYKEMGLNIVSENQIDGILKPMIGKMGDLILFDTNTPHKAGLIKDGESRKILRFDFEIPTYNEKYFIKKYFKKFFT